jgi:hypothetical protein
VSDLAGEARRLRREGLPGWQIQQRLGVPKQRLQDWLRGVPPPEWTKRPPAKDGLHARAIELREQGWSVNDIALEVGVARSTAADAAAARAWWIEQLGVAPARFLRTCLKRHKPATDRRNIDDDYHGCLAVSVRRSRTLYWRIEGIVDGLVGGPGSPARARLPIG